MTAMWKPIKTAPQDGKRVLLWCVCPMEERDEDDRLIGKTVERYAVVGYYAFGAFVEFPWRGNFVQNLQFTHWQPLPDGPPLTTLEGR